MAYSINSRITLIKRTLIKIKHKFLFLRLFSKYQLNGFLTKLVFELEYKKFQVDIKPIFQVY